MRSAAAGESSGESDDAWSLALLQPRERRGTETPRSAAAGCAAGAAAAAIRRGRRHRRKWAATGSSREFGPAGKIGGQRRQWAVVRAQGHEIRAVFAEHFAQFSLERAEALQIALPRGAAINRQIRSAFEVNESASCIRGKVDLHGVEHLYAEKLEALGAEEAQCGLK